MKDNFLEEGDELVVSLGPGTTPRVRRVERVTKAYAFAGEYRLHRKVDDNWVREVGRDTFSRRSFSIGNPETIAAAREASDIADACNEAYELGERLKCRVGQRGRVNKDELPSLREIIKQLAAFLTAAPTKEGGQS